MVFNKKTIERRSKRLEEARKYLKKEFIGIDECIDKFVDSVKVWYILPELQSRPLIVSLWGITGSGKTDLVRKFVNFLEFSDRFCEIQMDSKEGSATVESYLENTISHNESGVLLLDEMQRFRSVNEKGEENNSTKFQDVWMLLSDGVMQSNSKIKQELIQMMVEAEYWDEREVANSQSNSDTEPTNKDLEEKRKKFKYKMYHYEASRLKKLLKLEEDVDKVMTYSKEEKIQLIKSKINSKEIYEGKKYNKLLIVICGNLDDAFSVASNVDDTDHDADVYHNFSKTIDIITVKSALKNRFKPEQIARLGNIHIIYPILNRASNQAIIAQKIKVIETKILNDHSIDIVFDEKVHDVVYANGVFPVQGVRPLLSTISAIIENSLPIFLFEILKREFKEQVIITYSDGKLHATISGKKISYEIPRVLDEIRKKVSEDKLALVAVHEAGHAIAYALIRKCAPTQIVASTTNTSAGGFVGTHRTLGSKEDILNNILIDFAGRAAEELIFGADNITSGAASDYANATNRLVDMYRKLGMGNVQAIYSSNAKNIIELDSTSTVDGAIEAHASALYNESKN
jgi:cell division protease FtsH